MHEHSDHSPYTHKLCFTVLASLNDGVNIKLDKTVRHSQQLSHDERNLKTAFAMWINRQRECCTKQRIVPTLPYAQALSPEYKRILNVALLLTTAPVKSLSMAHNVPYSSNTTLTSDNIINFGPTSLVATSTLLHLQPPRTQQLQLLVSSSCAAHITHRVYF